MDNIDTFHFGFSLGDGENNVSFQEVSGISKELGVEEIISGVENRFKLHLPTVSAFGNLVLKRGITHADSYLLKWCSSTINEGLASAIKPREVKLSLLRSDGSVCILWTFHGAYPVKFKIDDLKREENTILIESIEFAYTNFEISQNQISDE